LCFRYSKVVKVNFNQHVCIIRAIVKNARPYVLQTLINSDSGQNQIDSHQAGGNREGLNFSQVKNMKYSFSVNSEEQTAIANILSDIDNETHTLDLRLAKSRYIKQRIMLGLFTGRSSLSF
jgi:type I restriction enzyme S subunit